MNSYKFTEHFFADLDRKEIMTSMGMLTHAERWKALVQVHQEKTNLPIKSFLEVGCFEGKASIWVCENVLHENGCVDVIDTFDGSDESGMESVHRNLKENKEYILENLKHNFSFFPNVKLNIHEGLSQEVLPCLALQEVPEAYDFIYIDGSHRADDTFVDAYYCYKMLKPKGLLIFDDYLWKDPKQPSPLHFPKPGIDFFHLMYEKSYDLIHAEYQIALIKK